MIIDDDYVEVYEIGNPNPIMVRTAPPPNNPARRAAQLMRSPDGTIMEVPSLDIPALTSLGWSDLSKLAPDACDACHGEGTINGEICWHCEGEQTDPTKG